VDGRLSDWVVIDALNVGLSGFGSLEVSTGGFVQVGTFFIAGESTSGTIGAPSAVTIIGSYSAKTVLGDAYVGPFDDGALTVSSGASVTVKDTHFVDGVKMQPRRSAH
jgi:T5SS/PEP-CTERM-associated repeat protein